MNVLSDYQIFCAQKFGGISRYHTDLIIHLGINLPFFISENLYQNDISAFLLPSRLPIRFSNNHGGKISRINNELEALLAIRLEEFDILHPTYYSTYYRWCNRKPVVLTVHDLINERYYFNNPKYTGYFKKKKAAIFNSQKIIAISETTKADLIKYYNLSKNKIDVVYHGISNKVLKVRTTIESEAVKFFNTEKYILFVGTRYGYKNFKFFAHEVKKVLATDTDLMVCCVGQPFDISENEMLFELGILQRCFSFFLDETELPIAYSNALIFVFPSKYEGFGYPILEACRNRCPVILADNDIFREITQNRFIYFDPDKEGSLSSILLSVLRTSNDLDELVNAGVTLVDFYSMESMLSNTKRVYASV